MHSTERKRRVSFFRSSERERPREDRKKGGESFKFYLLTRQLGQDRCLSDRLLPLEAECRLRGVKSSQRGAVGVEGGVVVVDKGLFLSFFWVELF